MQVNLTSISINEQQFLAMIPTVFYMRTNEFQLEFWEFTNKTNTLKCYLVQKNSLFLRSFHTVSYTLSKSSESCMFQDTWQTPQRELVSGE